MIDREWRMIDGEVEYDRWGVENDRWRSGE